MDDIQLIHTGNTMVTIDIKDNEQMVYWIYDLLTDIDQTLETKLQEDLE